VTLLFTHWSVDPFDLFALLAVVVYTVGHRRRIAALRRAGRPVGLWQWRAVAFGAGIGVLVLAIDSPLDYWSDNYLFAHMIQHILLAFTAPPLLVLAAPWLDLRRGLPAPVRRIFARAVQTVRRRPALRGTAAVLGGPWLAVLAFNAAMVFWHLPGPFDLALRNQTVHIWLEHGSFFGLGLLLWLQILDSPPFHPRLQPLGRVSITLFTNAVMVGVSITLVLFSHDLYPAYAHVPHLLFSQYSDQQVAGSALWVCGEFSLGPAVYWNVALWMRSQTRQQASVRSALAQASPWTSRASRWHDASPAAVETTWRTRPSRSAH
jgi:putative membrane protein